MAQNEKTNLSIGTKILIIIIFIIFILIAIFMITKNIFGYRPFLDYDEKNLIITKITASNKLKENDIIVFKTGNKFLEEKILKIDSQNNRYYYTVNNYDGTTTIVLNQDQIQGKVIKEIQDLGSTLVKMPFYLSIAGVVIIILFAVYIEYQRIRKN